MITLSPTSSARFSELRDIIASSRPGEQILLANVQLVRLD
jgi:hypothetical protein